jgi:hypothetical protein
MEGFRFILPQDTANPPRREPDRNTFVQRRKSNAGDGQADLVVCTLLNDFVGGTEEAALDFKGALLL